MQAKTRSINMPIDRTAAAYTSLRDLQPRIDPADSRIPIKNRLVEQAAKAYLSPFPGTKQSDFHGKIWRFKSWFRIAVAGYHSLILRPDWFCQIANYLLHPRPRPRLLKL